MKIQIETSKGSSRIGVSEVMNVSNLPQSLYKTHLPHIKILLRRPSDPTTVQGSQAIGK